MGEGKRRSEESGKEKKRGRGMWGGEREGRNERGKRKKEKTEKRGDKERRKKEKKRRKIYLV